MTFETEYQLSEFREIQPQYFRSNDEVYNGAFEKNILLRMLKLINQMEIEIEELEKENKKRLCF